MAEVAYMMEDYQLMAEACEKAKQLDNDNPHDELRLCPRLYRAGQTIINAIAQLSKAIGRIEGRNLLGCLICFAATPC
jgi:hypothetical protein